MDLKRKNSSHKGENGRVLVLGGNELYHGAPILVGLGAEKCGADMVYLVVPKNQQNLARNFSLNLIVSTFSGNFLRVQDVKKVLDWSLKVDVLVIGNGLGEKPQTMRAIKKIIQKCDCNIVIDAAALKALSQLKDFSFKNKEVVLTPHSGELEAMGIGNDKKSLVQASKKFEATIVWKGPEDFIVSPSGEIYINKTGHPIMTKGGTGDILAGLIGGLIAQGLSGFDAAKKACEEWGKVGEELYKKKGLMVNIQDLLEEV